MKFIINIIFMQALRFHFNPPSKLTLLWRGTWSQSSKQASIWSLRSTLFLFLGQVLRKLPLFAGLATALFAVSGMALSPNFVQGHSAVPQSTLTQVMVPYAAAQRIGDLNVVIVGWNDSSAQVSSADRFA